MSLSILLSEPLKKLLDDCPHLMIRAIEFEEDGTPSISILDQSMTARRGPFCLSESKLSRNAHRKAGLD
jgi:hypothetical protein